MSGGTPREAVEAFLRPLSQEISCVTPSILNVRGGYHPSEKPHSIIIGGGLPIRLAGPARLNLRLVHHYKIVGNLDRRRTWNIVTVGYFYALDNSNEKEIIAYRWHPDGQSPIRFRICTFVQEPPVNWKIWLRPLLRFAVTDFHVEPLRPDWAALLEQEQPHGMRQ